MQCINLKKYPNSKNLQPCKKCYSCKVNYQNEWKSRLQLEALTHKNVITFVTLTYDDEHLPDSDIYPAGNLNKKHLQDFIKRFRKNYQKIHGKRRIRYFACGEYGSKSQRAHYHLIFFGLDSMTQNIDHIVKKSWTLCAPERATAEAPRGDVSASLGYVLKYITKDLGSDSLEDGRQPPFSLKSQSLGQDFMQYLADILRKKDIYPIKTLDVLQLSAFHYIKEELDIDYHPDKPIELFNGSFILMQGGSLKINPSEHFIKRLKERSIDRFLGSVPHTHVKLPRYLVNKLLSMSHPELSQQLDTFLEKPSAEFFRYHSQRLNEMAESSLNMPNNFEHVHADGSNKHMTIKQLIEAKTAKALRKEQETIHKI